MDVAKVKIPRTHSAVSLKVLENQIFQIPIG